MKLKAILILGLFLGLRLSSIHALSCRKEEIRVDQLTAKSMLDCVKGMGGIECQTLNDVAMEVAGDFLEKFGVDGVMVSFSAGMLADRVGKSFFKLVMEKFREQFFSY